MIRFWDGLMSFLAAVLALAVSLVPAWFAHLAIDAGIAPKWGYAFVALLIIIALLAAFEFFRKARRGVSPSRLRAR